MKAALEGLLFLVGDEGITLEEITEILSINSERAEELLTSLSHDYDDPSRGIKLNKYGNLYKITTKNEYKDYYEKLTELTNMKTLSQSALETLAIIAYNQPITRLEVDNLRGINSSQMIRNLVARDFIKEVGRSDKIGRPILYGVTDDFLDYFGISSIDELPKPESIEYNNDDEIDLYESKYKEKVEEL